MDDIVERLLSDEGEDRIDALKELLSSEEVDWVSATPYFEQMLQPSSHTDIEELHLAVDAAVRAPLRMVHDLVVDLAYKGLEDERAEALMGLARIGETSGEDLLGLLTSERFEGPRELVAEHLLLVDVAPIKKELSALCRVEKDTKVRFWISGALSQVGDDRLLREDLHATRVPKSLRNRVKVVDAAKSAYTVEPRIERLEQPAYVDMVSAAEPTAEEDLAIEVRDEPGAGAPPADEVSPPPTRYFEGRAPTRVKLGDVVGVQLRVAIEQSPGAIAEAVNFDVPSEGLTLSITAYAPGFDLEGGQQFQELLVPPDTDSEWILYKLRALRDGVHDLIFTAFHPEGRMLGELLIQVSVDALAETAESIDVRSEVPSMLGDEGEVSLMIDWLDKLETYRFQLVDRSLPEEVVVDHVLRTPREVVESLIADLTAMAKGELGRGQNLRTMLRDRGVQLWNELIPETLKKQFWERQSRIKNLRIFARDDPVPWEVLYPLSEGNDAGFLVEQFPVLRSIRGLQPVSRIGSGPVETVVPSRNSPSSATGEADMVRRIWAARPCSAQVSDLASLRGVLDQASFGLLHLACHNSFDPNDPNHTNVKFGDGEFTPVILEPMIATGSLASARPLVFMNACRSAGEAPLYTRLSGWASNFMRAGAGAFVGSLWAVRDSSAKLFAQTFYEAVNGGLNMGEASLRARKAISVDHDPTWLAYTVYGDPRATI
jgi:hypothetical protein